MNMVRLIRLEVDAAPGDPGIPVAIHPNSCKAVEPEPVYFPGGVCAVTIRHGNELETIYVKGSVAEVTDAIDMGMRGFR